MSVEVKEESQPVSVMVGNWEYVPQKVNNLVKNAALSYATKRLLKYADKRWDFDKATGEYTPATPKDDFELAIFEGIFPKLKAIVAADRQFIIGSLDDLVALVDTDPEGFERLYKAAIEVNPAFAESN